MQQVLAEQALPHPLLEILMGGGDDAHVGFERCVTADPVVLAVGQDPQQAHLQVGRHVADLVEEQRTALGLLEPAAARALRAGERSALVAEELRLEQIFRNRCRIDRHERPACARTVAMERARHQLLPGAGLAGNQHRNV